MALWLKNPNFELGNNGDWVLSSAYSQINTVNPKTGSYSGRQTPAGHGGIVSTEMYQRHIDTIVVSLAKNKPAVFSGWVYCSKATGTTFGSSSYRIKIADGIGETDQEFYSMAATTWTFFTVSRTINPSATKVEFNIDFHKASTATQFTFNYDDCECTVDGSSTYTLPKGFSQAHIIG